MKAETHSPQIPNLSFEDATALPPIFDTNCELSKSISLPDLTSISRFFNKNFREYKLESILELGAAGVSGFTVIDGKISSVVGGIPLELAEVNLYIINSSWSNQGIVDYIQPFRSGSLMANGLERSISVLPIMGDFFIDHQQVDQKSLADLGIRKFIAAEQETAVTMPCFRQGGRGLILPGNFLIPVKKTENTGYQLDLSESAKDVIEGIAVQFRGVGLKNYQYHLAFKDQIDTNDSRLARHANAESQDSIFQPVQRSAYQGENGIFLDLKHEPYADSPTGATSSTSAQKDIERDARLWAEGAVMAGVTINSIPLLNCKDLARLLDTDINIPCDQLEVSVRVFFEDTHRLSAVIDGPKFKKGPVPSALAQYTIQRVYGDCSKESVHNYLEKLSSNISHNINICIKSKLGLKQNQITSDNLGLFGGILDSENFVDMQNRYQSLPLITQWFDNIIETAEACGVSLQEYVSSQAFDSFLVGFNLPVESTVNIKKLAIQSAKNASYDQQEIVCGIALAVAIDSVIASLHNEALILPIEDLCQALLDCPFIQKAMQCEGATRIVALPEFSDRLLVCSKDEILRVDKEQDFYHELTINYIHTALRYYSPHFIGVEVDPNYKVDLCREIEVSKLNSAKNS